MGFEMATETITSEVQLSAELRAATDAFAESLLAARPFVAYRQVEARLKQDREARSLLERLQACQASIRLKQADGRVTHYDIKELRTLQSDALANRTIAAYVDAQQGAVAQLRDVNTQISQLLGVDFAALAKRTSC